MKLRYTIFDTVTRRYLCTFHRPVEKLDAAVTQWTRYKEKALRFPGVKSARGVARWLDTDECGGCVVMNARGEIV